MKRLILLLIGVFLAACEVTAPAMTINIISPTLTVNENATISPSATPVTIPTEASQSDIVVTVENDNVYFRACASRLCEGIPLAGGTKLVYKGTSCVNRNGIEWAQVQYGKQIGWMSAAWLDGPEICR
jgi:hypothetical protein